MGRNKQQKQPTMKSIRPFFKREKHRDKDAFGKKTYTANDFLKDDHGASDWAELSDDGRSFLNHLRETAEDGARPNDGKKPKFTASPASQEEHVTGTGASQTVTAVAVGNEVTETLTRLLLERSTSQQMTDWIESNLGRSQTESHQFVRALMTSVCQAVISTVSDVHHVNVRDLLQRTDVLSRYLSDGRKQLEALCALEDVLERLEHPHNVLRLLFDILFDEAIVDEDTFYLWKVDAERRGSAAALRSVTDFFTCLHQ